MSMASFVTTDTKLKEDFDARVPALTARITPVQEKINKSAISDADKAALAAVAAARADVRGQGDRLKELVDAGDAAAKQAFLETVYRPKIMLYLESIDKFVALQERQRDEAVQAAQVAGTKMVWVAATVVVVLILLGMGLAALQVRSVTEPLDRAVDTANAIAAGDLTRELQTSRKDELGQMLRALSDMSARLRGVVSEVRPGVDSVSPPPSKSPTATTTSRPAPSRLQPTSKKPHPAWKSSPPPSPSRPIPPARPTSWPAPLPRPQPVAAKWWARW